MMVKAIITMITNIIVDWWLLIKSSVLSLRRVHGPADIDLLLRLGLLHTHRTKQDIVF